MFKWTEIVLHLLEIPEFRKNVNLQNTSACLFATEDKIVSFCFQFSW